MTLDDLFSKFETTTQKDMKLNFKKFYESQNLERKEAGLIALACSEAVNCAPLSEFLKGDLEQNGASPEEINEAIDAATVMGVANNYYRFRHWVEKDSYQKAAGFRMSMMMRPVTGKKVLEMMSLAVSVINGCEMCCVGHEKSCLEHGVSEDAVHDLVRLAATINGLEVCFRNTQN